MRDRLFYPLALLAAVAMIALALVWPQGMGATSPAPFGHPMGPAPPPEDAKVAPAKAALKALTAPPQAGTKAGAKPEPKLRPSIESTAP